MAKRHPEVYNAGDLDRTRSNLGELSREEAERMAAVLGGEVGVEKTDDELNRKYDLLRKTSTGRSYGAKTNKAGKTSQKKASPTIRKSQNKLAGGVYSGHYKKGKKQTPRLGYLDRIRIDRMAARPEHRVKTRSDALSSYFSFLFKRKDIINPEFITEGDSYYYSHIEKMVSGLRILLKMTEPKFFRTYINPFYRDLLKVLISWDLKEISGNLADLQKSPRNREIRDCGNLCTMIYRPIIIAHEIELKYFYAAVDRLCKVLQIIHSEEPEELIVITNRSIEIKENIKIVLKDIAYTCYPLLLKLTGSGFCYFREFLNGKRNMLIEFLEIKDEDRIRIPEDLGKELKKQYSLTRLKERLEKEKQEMLAEKTAGDSLRGEEEIEITLNMLEKLFPESRWKEYKKSPDMFPYFHPLFNFPRGTELVASEDPLQQVLVLSAIIQDLLYGFRSIKINAEQKEAIEKTADKWHLFIDELIQNNYCKFIVEYCRNIEKGTDYTANQFGQKLLTDIFWFKRKFIMPFMKFKVLYKSESIPLKAPKFHEQVRLFYTSLNSLLEDFDKSDDRRSLIENYDAKFHFEIPNITSYRLKKILAADNIAPTNENLLRYTFMLVSLLDFLINSENSPFYAVRADEQPIYRYDPVYQGKPLYSITLIETEKLLKKYS